MNKTWASKYDPPYNDSYGPNENTFPRRIRVTAVTANGPGFEKTVNND